MFEVGSFPASMRPIMVIHRDSHTLANVNHMITSSMDFLNGSSIEEMRGGLGT